MKFNRVNDNTVNCIISREELAGNGVTLEDIMSRKPEAIEYLHRVIAEASKAVHMQMTTGFTSMQIQARGDGSILLTISNGVSAEDGRGGTADPMAAIKDAIECILGSTQERIFGKEEAETCAARKDDLQNGHKDSATEAASCRKRSLYCYMFHSLSDAIECCRRLPLLANMESSLWQNRSEGFYYLFVKVNIEGEDAFPERTVLAMNEFGSCCDATPESAAYIMEHEKCILDKNAAASLARM